MLGPPRYGLAEHRWTVKSLEKLIMITEIGMKLMCARVLLCAAPPWHVHHPVRVSLTLTRSPCLS